MPARSILPRAVRIRYSETRPLGPEALREQADSQFLDQLPDIAVLLHGPGPETQICSPGAPQVWVIWHRPSAGTCASGRWAN